MKKKAGVAAAVLVLSGCGGESSTQPLVNASTGHGGTDAQVWAILPVGILPVGILPAPILPPPPDASDADANRDAATGDAAETGPRDAGPDARNDTKAVDHDDWWQTAEAALRGA